MSGSDYGIVVVGAIVGRHSVIGYGNTRLPRTGMYLHAGSCHENGIGFTVAGW